MKKNCYLWALVEGASGVWLFWSWIFIHDTIRLLYFST